MKVIALKPCFVGGAYRKVGDIFEADDKLNSRSKNPPFKVVKDEASAKAEAASVKKSEAEKKKAGALAASGGAAARAKSEALASELTG